MTLPIVRDLLMPIVYLHRNKLDCGKVYIGYTTKSIEERWNEHVQAARAGAPYYFNRTIGKYGSTDDVWEHVILIDCPTVQDAQTAEMVFIAEFRSDERDYGYNLTKGGEGVHPNEETRKKQGEISRRRHQQFPESRSTREKKRVAMLGPKNPNYGKKFSEEHRRNISEAQKNMSSEKRAKISAAQRGVKRKPRTPDHSKKISQSRKGKCIGEAHPMFNGHPRQKLSIEQVIEIKSSDPAISHKELSAKFNVLPGQIYAIRTGKVWKHVRPDLTRPGKTFAKRNLATSKASLSVD